MIRATFTRLCGLRVTLIADSSGRRSVQGFQLAALLGVFAFATQSAKSADWPQWLGPTRNGASSETVSVWTSEPKVLWRKPVSNGYSSPVVSDGLVFVHGAGEGDSEAVLAFNADSGEQAWGDSYPREKYSS